MPPDTNVETVDETQDNEETYTQTTGSGDTAPATSGYSLDALSAATSTSTDPGNANAPGLDSAPVDTMSDASAVAAPVASPVLSAPASATGSVPAASATSSGTSSRLVGIITAVGAALLVGVGGMAVLKKRKKSAAGGGHP